MAIVKIPRKLCYHLNENIGMLQDYITLSIGSHAKQSEGQIEPWRPPPQSCEHCYAIVSDYFGHRKRCMDMPMYARRFVIFSLDSVTYLCQFGCENVRLQSRM